MNNGRITYAPNGYEPVTTWECSQRGDVWTSINAITAARAAILQAQRWMELGYQLPMLVIVREAGGEVTYRYRVRVAEITASLIEPNKDAYEIIRLER